MAKSRISAVLLISLSIVLAMIIINAKPAQAALLQAGSSFNLPKGKTIKNDLYVAARDIKIDGNIKGDLIVAGANVIVNGRVSGDVLSAASTTKINGEVNGSLRNMSGLVDVRGKVANDLVVMTGNVLLKRSSIIGRDALVGAGSLISNGKIFGYLKASTGQAKIDGFVGKDTIISTNKLVVGERAYLGGNLIYRSSLQGKFSNKAKINGKVKFSLAKQQPTPRRRFLLWLWSVASIGVTGAAVSLIYPKTIKQMADIIDSRSIWLTILWGIATLFLVPAAAIIMVSITLSLALPLSLIVMVIYTIGLYLSSIAFSGWLGRKILALFWKEQQQSVTWHVLTGLVVIWILGTVPYLGPIIRFAVLIVGLGLLAQQGRESYLKARDGELLQSKTA
jgi:cytoskeletal protein CcmA (bactofilin family)